MNTNAYKKNKIKIKVVMLKAIQVNKEREKKALSE